ncbi:MAG: ABC transporter permease [Bacteroidota bacterium]
MKNTSNPPKLFLLFFRWFCNPNLRDPIEGDLMELYYERVEDEGKSRANRKFMRDVLLLFRPGIIRALSGYKRLNTYDMIKHNLIISWRNLAKHTWYSIINIGGLALGMITAILIGLWIHDELTFNKYHEHYDKLAKVYRSEIWQGEVESGTSHVTGLGTLLQSDYDNVFERVAMVRARVEYRVVAVGDKKFTEGGYFMQPQGPEMFSLNMIHGTRQGLSDMNSILLSESLARKLFGNENPVNQVVKMDAEWDLTVTGVYEDLPDNSELNEATYFAPLDRYLEGWAHLNVWDNYNMYIYAQIRENTDFEQASATIKDAMLPHINEKKKKGKPSLFLHPMSEWHLNSEFENGHTVVSGRMKIVWFYGLIAAFVLLLACINFMNLSTARSENRAKEVGVRKTIGSVRSQLILQFLTESLMIAVFSMIMAIATVHFVLPWFNEVSNKDLEILWSHPSFWISLLSFTVITALLAGSYPAFFLSSFNPIKVLKGVFRLGRAGTLPRKILVVVQFTVSTSLVIGTMVVYLQIQMAKERPAGYVKERLITLRPRSPEFDKKHEALQSELMQTGVVTAVGQSNYSLTSTRGWNHGFDWQGREDGQDPAFNTIFVSPEYGQAVGWEVVAGEDFSREKTSDLAGIIINESALEIMGLENPVGQVVTFNPNWMDGKDFIVLGVVKDMIKGSPFEATHPSIIFNTTSPMGCFHIRINAGAEMKEALEQIEAVYSSLIPDDPFDYEFLDQSYAAKFGAEERVGKLSSFFTLLAILISCLGLFGLSSYVAGQRTKEIGIRKVLGASVVNLWRLLSKDFVILVIIACLVSLPLAYYVLDYWLQSYEEDFRIDIPYWVLFSTVIGAVLVTLLTVSFQSIKAALANPVKSLKTE